MDTIREILTFIGATTIAALAVSAVLWFFAAVIVPHVIRHTRGR